MFCVIGQSAYENITQKVPGGPRNIRASDFYGKDNRNIKFHETGKTTPSYNPSEIDRSFNSPNVEVGTVGVFKLKEGYKFKKNEAKPTGHVITVSKEVEKDSSGKTIRIHAIEGQLGYPPRRKTFENEKALHDHLPGCYFVGWGEWEPNKKTNIPVELTR